MKEPNKFHNYETEKITRKASDAAEYIRLFGRAWRSRVEEPEQLDIIASFLPRHWLYKWFSSADICFIVLDNLGWKNQKTRCNRFWRAGCSRLEYVDIRLVYY